MLGKSGALVHVAFVFACFMINDCLTYGVSSAPRPIMFGVSAVLNDQNNFMLNDTVFETTDDSGNKEVNVFMDERIDLKFVLLIGCTRFSPINIEVSSPENPAILKIVSNTKMNFTCENGGVNDGSDDKRREIVIHKEVMITLQSGNIGVSYIVFEVTDDEDAMYVYDSDVESVLNVENNANATDIRAKVDVYVIRDTYWIDIVFVVTVYTVEILEMLTFGSQLDFDVVTHTLKKPVPLLIGSSCQYVGMPLIAFAIARVVASDSVTAIGIFVAGICPGGGSSNIYSYLLDGDLSLSITMTTVSTILSLGMMPLWLYTLGEIFLDAHELAIPYTDIVVTLSVIIVPLAGGLLIRNKLPKIVQIVEKVLTVVITITALVLIVTGVISSLYLINLFNLKIILVGCFLPYVGFLLGALAAFIFKQPFGNIKTIAIGAGLQNTAIAMILLQNSFPAPFGDLATVAPVAAEVMSPIPPFVTSIVYLIHKKCCKSYKQVQMTKTAELANKQTDSDELESDNEYSI